MRKPNRYREFSRHQRREKKELRRRRNRRPYIEPYNKNERIASSYRRKRDNRIVSEHKNAFFDFLKASNLSDKSKKYIKVGKNFSIFVNPDEVFRLCSIVNNSINHFNDDFITIDFSDCELTDLHSLFILRVIGSEHRFNQIKLQEKLKTKDVITNIVIKQSRIEEVNKRLLAAEIVPTISTKIEKMMPISKMGLYIGTGSQLHPNENKKGPTATKIVKYLTDNCLSRFGYKLSPQEKNDLISLISEILNNCEDHSHLNKWYATGALFEDNRIINNPDKDIIGEISVTIMNFGQTFFEGVEDTKLENVDMYKGICALYEKVSKEKGGDQFSKENYVTLYSLQEGVSRLKFEDESRGTGTMKFINCFMNINNYEDLDKKYHPYLAILTGKTLIKCDNRYKPFVSHGKNFLSLNKENDLTKPPESQNLISLNSKFPGTLLAVNIYLKKSL
jgi:hypothetical protein